MLSADVVLFRRLPHAYEKLHATGPAVLCRHSSEDLLAQIVDALSNRIRGLLLIRSLTVQQLGRCLYRRQGCLAPVQVVWREVEVHLKLLLDAGRQLDAKLSTVTMQTGVQNVNSAQSWLGVVGVQG